MGHTSPPTTIAEQLNASADSAEDSAFLRICRVGDDICVGKLIYESLTTNRVDDIRRNVLSITRRLGSEVRLPNNLKILACSAVEADSLPTACQLSSPRSVAVVPAPHPAVH